MPEPAYPPYYQRSGSVVPFILLAVVIIVVIGVVYYYRTRSTEEEEEEEEVGDDEEEVGGEEDEDGESSTSDTVVGNTTRQAGYTFFANLDPSGDSYNKDYFGAYAGQVNALATICDQYDYSCAGFNTGGWLKNRSAPTNPLLWSDWMVGDPNAGYYRKN